MGRPLEDDILRSAPRAIAGSAIGGYWAVMQAAGKLVRVMSTPGAAGFIPEMYRVFAAELCLRLNKEIALDGSWIVSWSEFDLKLGHPRRFDMLWRDKGGDVPFVVTSEDRIDVAMLCQDDYLGQCLEAWTTHKAFLKDAGIREDQKIHAVLGEKSRDARAMPEMIPEL